MPSGPSRTRCPTPPEAGRPPSRTTLLAFAPAMSDVRTDLTTPKGAYERLADIQLVDCREPYEWSAGRVEGAVHIPLNTIMAGATAGLDPGKPVVVGCRSGHRRE